MNFRYALAAASFATAIICLSTPLQAEQRVIVMKDAGCVKSFDYINGSGSGQSDNHIDVSEAISADMPDSLFDTLDVDKDLIITREEFANCVSYTDEFETWTTVIIDEKPVPTRTVSQNSVCDYSFSILNRSAAVDNHISFEEAQSWKISAETFARLDADSDGMVRREEFLACKTIQ